MPVEYLSLAESTRLERPTPHPSWQSLARTSSEERGSLRGALGWSEQVDDTALGSRAQGLRLACALAPFWGIRGHYREGRGWLKLFLDDAQADTGLRATAVYGAGWLALEEGDYAAAQIALEDSLAAYRGLDDRPAQARVLTVLGRMWRDRGDYARAEALHAEGLALYTAAGDSTGIAFVLTNLGLLA